MKGYDTWVKNGETSFGMSISQNDNHYNRYAAWYPFSSYGVQAIGAFSCQLGQNQTSNMDITFHQPLKLLSIDFHIMSGWGFSGKPTIKVFRNETLISELTKSVPAPSGRYEFTPASMEMNNPDYATFYRIQISPMLAAICALKLHGVYIV